MEMYNDYYRLTEGYLKNYTRLHVVLENLMLVKEQKEAEISDIKIPIAKYGVEPGGSNELTITEAYSENLLYLQKDLHILNGDILALKIKIKQLKLAIESLSDVDRKLIELRYQKGMQWKEICEDVGYSEVQSKRRTYQAVGQIAKQLFGYRMLIDERRFLFIC
jgi:DNA-directed RNA polymerase specialized sigma subunit